MYGYSVVGLRVRRADGSGGPLQIDNVDGRGLDLGAQWQAFFRDERSDHLVRSRRYWRSSPVRRSVQPSSPHRWLRLDVEYGPNGIPGRVLDTAAGRPTASVRPQDATVHRYRHLLAVPRAGTAALLAAEVIGRSHAFRGPVSAFTAHLEQAITDVRVESEYLADGEYWDEFLERAALVSATLTRQSAIPAYSSGSISGQSVQATIETTIKATARGARLPKALLRPLLARSVSPRDAFGVSFHPERTSLLLECRGQRRQVYLDASEPARLVYPLGD
ncbi:MAG TPA: hypothetical protein VHX15_12045, partial [Frankiaceae bacterium]|nr:hypothetical protein [Frankiaceae bacterium]